MRGLGRPSPLGGPGVEVSPAWGPEVAEFGKDLEASSTDPGQAKRCVTSSGVLLD